MTTVLAFLSRWFAQPDKVLHAAAGLLGFLVLMAAYQACHQVAPMSMPLVIRLVIALSLVAFVGWLKERYDKAHPEAHDSEGWDAYATTVGALAGANVWVCLVAPMLGLS
jgi:hypothetical protein